MEVGETQLADVIQTPALTLNGTACAGTDMHTGPDTRVGHDATAGKSGARGTASGNCDVRNPTAAGGGSVRNNVSDNDGDSGGIMRGAANENAGIVQSAAGGGGIVRDGAGIVEVVKGGSGARRATAAGRCGAARGHSQTGDAGKPDSAADDGDDAAERQRPGQEGGAGTQALRLWSLVCAMCSQHFRNPKILPCLHTFCEDCLRKHVPAESLSVSCPSCKQQSILPPDGVRGLQRNVLLAGEDVNHAEDGGGEERRESSTTPELKDGSTRDDESDSSGESSSSAENSEEEEEEEDAADEIWRLYCVNHTGQTLRFYCRDCETAVCASCTDILHAPHRTCRLSEMAAEQRSALLTLRQRVTQQAETQRRRRERLRGATGQLRHARHLAEQQLEELCAALAATLARRREELLASLQRLHTDQQLQLDKQAGRLDAFLLELEACGAHMDHALDSGTDTEVLLLNKQVAVRVAEPPAEGAPPSAELRFEPTNTDRLEAQLRCFGTVSAGDEFPTTAARGAASPGGQVTFCGTVSPVQTPASSSDGDHLDGLNPRTNGQRAQHSSEDLRSSSGRSSQQQGEPGGRRTSRPVSRASPSPLSAGSRSSRSSRTSLGSSRRSAPPPQPPPQTDDLVLSIGTKGRARGEFSNPQGVCFAAAANRLLVADSNNQCVQAFSLDGECRLRFGVRGRSPGQMQRPCGVACTPEGNFVVSDYENKCLSVFDQLGKLVRRIGQGKLQGPKGVTTDGRGHLLAVDNRGSCVVTFSQGGRLMARFGSRGTGQHQFAGPHYVAVDSQQRIIVTDFHNHSVKVFSSDGQHLFTFGGNGEAAGQFNAPTGVATDRYDNILVADWGNSRVQVFDNTGQYLSTINSSVSPLYGPQGLAMSPEGHVIVADTGNHAVKLYAYHPLPV